MDVKISVCNRRTDKKYKNQEHPWEYIVSLYLKRLCSYFFFFEFYILVLAV